MTTIMTRFVDRGPLAPPPTPPVQESANSIRVSAMAGMKQLQLHYYCFFINKLPLYMITHHMVTTKQALTLHIKPLGLCWESGSCEFHLNCRFACLSNGSPPLSFGCHFALVDPRHCQILTLQNALSPSHTTRPE
jgi:hypothetical protein